MTALRRNPTRKGPARPASLLPEPESALGGKRADKRKAGAAPKAQRLDDEMLPAGVFAVGALYSRCGCAPAQASAMCLPAGRRKWGISMPTRRASQ